jgi:hypothetical protein
MNAKPERNRAGVDSRKRLPADTTVNNTGQAAAELDAFPLSPGFPTSLELRWTSRRTGLPASRSNRGLHLTAAGTML